MTSSVAANHQWLREFIQANLSDPPPKTHIIYCDSSIQEVGTREAVLDTEAHCQPLRPNPSTTGLQYIQLIAQCQEHIERYMIHLSKRITATRMPYGSYNYNS